jgi:hypothetical protein
MSRLSAHLGPVRRLARPGGLVADLYGILAGPVPPHGLRISAVGLQFGACMPWVPRAGPGERPGDAEDDVELPPGAWPISEPFEVQALLAACDGGTTGSAQDHMQGSYAEESGSGADGPNGSPVEASTCSTAAPAGGGNLEGGTVPGLSQSKALWALSVAVAPVCLRFRRTELAVLAAIGDAVSAEAASLGTEGAETPALPQQATLPKEATWQPAPEEATSWVDGMGLDVQGLCCVVASGEVPELASQPCAPCGSHVLLQCREALLWLQGASAGTLPLL